MHRTLILLFALLLNALFGGPRQFYAAIGISRFGRLPVKWLRELDTRKAAAQPLFITASLVIAAIVCGLILGVIFRASDITGLLGIALLALLLPVRPAWDAAWAIRSSLQKNNVQAAKSVLEGSIWRHHAILDAHGVARAAIETLAITYSEKILAVVGMYLLAGWPGVLVFKLAGWMQEANVSYSPEKTIGPIAQNIMYVWPQTAASWLSTVLWVIAGLFLPGFDMPRVTKALNENFMLLDYRKRTLKTAATILKLSLGGPASAYDNTAWQGNGTTKPGTPEIARALFVYGLLNLFLFILLGFSLG